MSLRDALNATANISSVAQDANGQETLTPIYTNVLTRVEEVQRLIKDKLANVIVTNFLFFFDVVDVPAGGIKSNYIITYSGTDYEIVKAILLDDLTSDHHWEVFTI